MNKHAIKFIAADMDGTLLNEKQQLPDGFFDIYQRLKEQNIIFAAASGRQYFSLVDTFAPIKDEMMFIAENGTLVMHQGKELYSCPLESGISNQVIEQTRKIDGAHIVLCGKNSAYVETTDQQALAEIGKYYHRCQSVNDLTQVDDEFIKIAICHFGGTQEHVYPSLNEHFGANNQVVVSAAIWIDIMNIKASKGAAIEHLQKTLGFSFDQTMSFGDYHNDVEMLQASYHAYAVENAHDAVKAHARFIAPANHKAGVLSVIQEQVLTKSA